jgi:DNA (cytosine-5)-methyltransferase 1
MKPRVLDLFCGAGGAAIGYHRAGFSVVGVDIEPQPNYPFCFLEGDALSVEFSSFDLIHASPPCQRWSTATPNKKIHPDFLRPIQERLKNQEIPYIIENVVGAPLLNPILLCGLLFPELRVLRHRLFECSFDIPQPKLDCENHPILYSNDKKSKYFGQLNEWTDYLGVYGGNHASINACRDAMGLYHTTRKELSEAIPPPYTQFIGEYFLKHHL